MTKNVVFNLVIGNQQMIDKTQTLNFLVDFSRVFIGIKSLKLFSWLKL